jgi:hypothetical protein
VTTASGIELRAHVAVPLGHPTRALSYEHLVQKFADCCAVSRLGGELNVDAVVRFIDTLEEAQHVAPLAQPARIA